MEDIKELVKYSVTDEALAQYREEFLPLTIKDLDDVEGYEKVRDARLFIKAERVNVEKKRVSASTNATIGGNLNATGTITQAGVPVLTTSTFNATGTAFNFPSWNASGTSLTATSTITQNTNGDTNINSATDLGNALGVSGNVFFSSNDFLKATTTAGFATNSTSIQISTTTGLAPNGYVIINPSSIVTGSSNIPEVAYYSSFTSAGASSTLNGLVRARFGTSAISEGAASSTEVYAMPVVIANSSTSVPSFSIGCNGSASNSCQIAYESVPFNNNSAMPGGYINGSFGMTGTTIRAGGSVTLSGINNGAQLGINTAGINITANGIADNYGKIFCAGVNGACNIYAGTSTVAITIPYVTSTNPVINLVSSTLQIPTLTANSFLATDANNNIIATGTPAFTASTTITFGFYNATTTMPYGLEETKVPTKVTATYADCSEYASATTTLEIYYNTTLASSGIQQVVLPSLVCGTAGNSTTSFTTSTIPLGAYLYGIVSSTAGTPTFTNFNLLGTKS